MAVQQDKLIQFCIKELGKALQDVKQGKEPKMSSSMQKIADELDNVNDTYKNMTEEEVKNFAEKLLKDISEME